MPTSTSNFGLSKPLVNDPTDEDLWGGELNDNADELDGLLLTTLNLTPSTKTANFTVTARTNGTATTGSSRILYLCDATAGAIIGALPAAATASGMVVAFKKIDASANTVTLDGNGTEKIDANNTYVLSNRWDFVVLQCDGVGWNIISQNPTAEGDDIRNVKTQTFTTPGAITYTPSDGIIKVVFESVAGGGGSAGKNTSLGGTPGGSAGSYVKVILTAAELTSALTLGSVAGNIGAAGTAGTSGPTAGGVGGITSITGIFSCPGGPGGPVDAFPGSAGQTVGPTAAAAATVSLGTTLASIAGQAGSDAGQNALIISGSGGSNPLGFGGGQVVTGSGGGTGGKTGTGYGAGGGGAAVPNGNAVAGAPGTSGIIIVTEYCSE